MQTVKPEEALKELELAEKDANKAKANDIFLNVQTIKGHIIRALGEYEEALKIHVLSLKAIEESLFKDPANEFYQGICGTN